MYASRNKYLIWRYNCSKDILYIDALKKKSMFQYLFTNTNGDLER